MKGELLSNKYEVRVKSHGGCIIGGMYQQVPKMVSLKPAFIVLHVATNDCPSKTSCEILQELISLADHIQELFAGIRNYIIAANCHEG